MRVAVVVACLLVVVLAVGADAGTVSLRATFYEQHNWDNLGESGGATNTNLDALSDVWSLSFVGGPLPGGLSIDKVTITAPTNAYFDVDATYSDPGSFFAITKSFSGVSGTEAVDDRGTTFAWTFASGSFGDALSDMVEWTVDVDNSNAVVRGEFLSSPHAGWTNGGKLTVDYTLGGTSYSTTVDWLADPTNTTHKAYAEVTIVPLPPALWAGLGLLGALGFVRRRRRRIA